MPMPMPVPIPILIPIPPDIADTPGVSAMPVGIPDMPMPFIKPGVDMPLIMQGVDIPDIERLEPDKLDLLPNGSEALEAVKDTVRIKKGVVRF